jgi:hypothetical protein
MNSGCKSVGIFELASNLVMEKLFSQNPIGKRMERTETHKNNHRRGWGIWAIIGKWRIEF